MGKIKVHIYNTQRHSTTLSQAQNTIVTEYWFWKWPSKIGRKMTDRERTRDRNRSYRFQLQVDYKKTHTRDSKLTVTLCLQCPVHSVHSTQQTDHTDLLSGPETAACDDDLLHSYTQTSAPHSSLIIISSMSSTTYTHHSSLIIINSMSSTTYTHHGLSNNADHLDRFRCS